MSKGLELRCVCLLSAPSSDLPRRLRDGDSIRHVGVKADVASMRWQSAIRSTHDFTHGCRRFSCSKRGRMVHSAEATHPQAGGGIGHRTGKSFQALRVSHRRRKGVERLSRVHHARPKLSASPTDLRVAKNKRALVHTSMDLLSHVAGLMVCA